MWQADNTKEDYCSQGASAWSYAITKVLPIYTENCWSEIQRTLSTTLTCRMRFRWKLLRRGYSFWHIIERSFPRLWHQLASISTILTVTVCIIQTKQCLWNSLCKTQHPPGLWLVNSSLPTTSNRSELKMMSPLSQSLFWIESERYFYKHVRHFIRWWRYIILANAAPKYSN